MDYKKAVQIIKDGGYATSLTYVEKLCSIIERWELTQYDVYDWNGKQVYPEVAEGATGGMSNADCPFLVKVSIDDLNIRKGAGTNTVKTGDYTGVGMRVLMFAGFFDFLKNIVYN